MNENSGEDNYQNMNENSGEDNYQKTLLMFCFYKKKFIESLIYEYYNKIVRISRLGR